MKILFLEDNDNIREVLSEYLRKEGYEVFEFARGDLAYASLLSDHYDLAILDIMVPGMTGIEILKKLGEQKKENLAVIMLSALSDELSQYQSFDLFADDYIVKPVSPLLLLKRVEAILRRYMPLSSKFQVLSEASEILVAGKKINLTITEFLLVKTLYEDPHKAFSREELISAIYWDEYLGSDRVVDAHIKNIRKKMPFNPIKTIIGLGYRFDLEALDQI